MRGPYVRFAKKYIDLNKKHHDISQIKKGLIKFGTTNEEFDEALRQIKKVPKSSIFPTRLPKPSPSLIKKTATAVVTFIALVSLVYTTFIYQNPKSPPFQQKALLTATVNNEAADSHKEMTRAAPPNDAQNPIPHVYANTKPIDAEKVFSIPHSGIPLAVSSKPKKEVLGFLPYWMLLYQDEIEISHLTSISLFGLEVNGKGEIITANNEGQQNPGWTMWKDPILDDFIKRAKDQNLKMFLTFKSFSNTNIENLISSDDAQKTFISNSIYLVNSKNLDGINIDFEYLGKPPDSVRNDFTRFVTNLNTELKRQIPDAVLTLDTYITSGSERDLFDIQSLAEYLDAFVIMGYDIHYALGSAGPLAPMGGSINIIGLVQGYLEKVSPDKLILAVPYYGYDWPINIGSPSDTTYATILSYAEVAKASQDRNMIWDETTQTPLYRYTENGIQREVHFENVRSLGIKYDFVNTKGLKGVGIWALGYDGLNSDLQRLIVDKFAN